MILNTYFLKASGSRKPFPCVELVPKKCYNMHIKAYRCNQEVERCCNEQGISFYQYEKQCFRADRSQGIYPEPEAHNPERQQEIVKDIERSSDRGEIER